jgi:DNA-binding transcriptional ArsR family regulator
MQTPILLWDIGAAYDMFISLDVLHAPDKYGLRGAWAAGVRSRLPNPEREALQNIIPLMRWPLHWIYSLPAPKDGGTVLRELNTIPPAERLPQLLYSPAMPAHLRGIILDVAARRSWTEAELQEVQSIYQGRWGNRLSAKEIKEEALRQLTLWSLDTAFGEGLLAGLQVYYEVFFAEEEMRIRPALEEALEKAKLLASSTPLPELVEALSQGVRLTKEFDMSELVLVPSYWADPLMVFGKLSAERDIFVFGGRPADSSLVPGAVVPDALFQSLKALADPTRLRILRYLSEEPLTPAELARRLRLRAPTVIHHLHALRLARLVHLTLEPEGKRYQARHEAVGEACAMLTAYLEKGAGDDLQRGD